MPLSFKIFLLPTILLVLEWGVINPVGILTRVAHTLVHWNGRAPVIDLGYAQYRGVFDSTNNVSSYLGMRYADSPTGSLRFRAPKQPSKIHGIQKATSQPVSCIQADTYGRAPTNPYGSLLALQDSLASQSDDDYSQSEDCLFINVYHSGPTAPYMLPVVVYIHGGGYTQAQMSLFDGQDLVVESRHGVVAVLLQYRLGLFGFLAGQDIKDGGNLNAGLLDQDLALRWVQEHISKFGGDPQKVTIWGTSAGGGAVLQHLVANGGQTVPPLFRGAIASSPFFPPQYSYNDPVSEKIYTNVVTMANCSSSSNKLECLRNADVATLKKVNSEVNRAAFYGTYLMVPVVDGQFIRENPMNALKEGKVNGEAILSVTNTFEGAGFINKSTANTVDVTLYAQQLFPKFGKREASAAAAEYADIGTPATQVAAILGESMVICPAYFALAGSIKRGFDRAFKGTYAIPPGRHGDDLPYYFTTGWTRTFPNEAFTLAFAQSFMSFVISLDPNAKVDKSSILPPWPLWSRDSSQREMNFNKTVDDLPSIHGIDTDDGLLRRCKFWDSIHSLIGQ